jgi:hypothetical protein
MIQIRIASQPPNTVTTDVPLWTRDAKLARAAERLVAVECPRIG